MFLKRKIKKFLNDLKQKIRKIYFFFHTPFFVYFDIFI